MEGAAPFLALEVTPSHSPGHPDREVQVQVGAIRAELWLQDLGPADLPVLPLPPPLPQPRFGQPPAAVFQPQPQQQQQQQGPWQQQPRHEPQQQQMQSHGAWHQQQQQQQLYAQQLQQAPTPAPAPASAPQGAAAGRPAVAAASPQPPHSGFDLASASSALHLGSLGPVNVSASTPRIGQAPAEFRAAWELESWKRAEETKWRAELKTREVQRMAALEAVRGACAWEDEDCFLKLGPEDRRCGGGQVAGRTQGEGGAAHGSAGSGEGKCQGREGGLAFESEL